MPTPKDGIQLTTLQRRLIAGVAVGAAAIATIGFVGSYAAVRRLAKVKGFGTFALAFPIGIDAGILVLLALDLLLTWLRMPLGMLRHTAWLLTTATIAFNAAAAAGDPLAMGMHAVIPVLFVVVVEAARHAIGQSADIVAGRHMESVRVSRWLLDPIATFRLWRRMKLWELRSYEQVIALEQQRLIERARLRAKYGRRWRSKAPVDAVLALRLTRYGRALGDRIEGVLNIEHTPAAAPVLVSLAAQPEVRALGPAQPQPGPAAQPDADSSSKVPSASGAEPSIVDAARTDARNDFDTAAATAIAVTQPVNAQPRQDPAAQSGADDECAADDPQSPEEDAQPDALVLDLAAMRAPHPDVCAPAPGKAAQPPARRSPRRTLAKQSGRGRDVVSMQLPEGDAQFLEKARELNVNSLREDGCKAPLRLLQAELGVGQRRAQRLQKALPDTLAAALAEAQPHAKEA